MRFKDVFDFRRPFRGQFKISPGIPQGVQYSGLAVRVDVISRLGETPGIKLFDKHRAVVLIMLMTHM
jgi:hypothetical protein